MIYKRYIHHKFLSVQNEDKFASLLHQLEDVDLSTLTLILVKDKSAAVELALSLQELNFPVTYTHSDYQDEMVDEFNTIPIVVTSHEGRFLHAFEYTATRVIFMTPQHPLRSSNIVKTWLSFLIFSTP